MWLVNILSMSENESCKVLKQYTVLEGNIMDRVSLISYQRIRDYVLT